MILLPSRSAWLHLRFAFSLFLLPVFIFSLSQAPHANTLKVWLAFLSWHFFIYPASNGYNSYFDRDEGSIALLESPPKVDKSLYWLSLTFDILGIFSALFVSLEFAMAVFFYGILSKLYSHPSTRLKKYPVISFLVVFFFQGAFVYFTSYAAICGLSVSFLINNDSGFVIAGLICSCLIGASYPLTQIYQHKEDKKRGDITLSILLGIKGSFLFSGLLFTVGILLMFIYWSLLGKLFLFYIFLIFIIPVLALFISWLIKTWNNAEEANFKNMNRMTFLSGIVMLMYFLLVWILD